MAPIPDQRTTPRAVVVAFPHTSYLDAVPTCFIARVTDGQLAARSSWWTYLLSWCYLIPFLLVKRNAKLSQTNSIAAALRERERCWLFIAPEGTTKKAEGVKSGFHTIAVKAKVPIILSNYDHQRSECRFSEPIDASKYDAEEMVAFMKTWYEDRKLLATGRNPEQVSPCELASKKTS